MIFSKSGKTFFISVKESIKLPCIKKQYTCTSSCILIAFEATLKESTVRFFYKKKKIKEKHFIAVIIFPSIGCFILSCDLALLDLYV